MLASQMDEPVFLAAEDGLSGLPGIQHWEIRSFQDAIEAITALHEEHPFKSVGFDTVSAFEPMLHRRLLENWGVDSIDKVGANGGGYYKWRNEALLLWQDILDGLDSLRINKGMRIILIGHSIDKEVKPPEADPYRKYTIDLLNDKASSLLYRWTDVVGFCNYRISVTGTTRDKRGQVTKAGRAIGTGERVMYLSERPAFYYSSTSRKYSGSSSTTPSTSSSVTTSDASPVIAMLSRTSSVARIYVLIGSSTLSCSKCCLI